MKISTSLQCPDSDDRDAWIVYWRVSGRPWRTEPEIGINRQLYLTQRREITPDIKRGVYPFRDVKLNRADIEWLLATQENGLVTWHGEQQFRGKGLDLRGADLRLADLQDLPLTYARGGLGDGEWNEATLEQRDIARVQLKGANLRRVHLEGAILRKADLSGTNLEEAHLEGADFYRAHLEGAYLRNAYLGGASLRRVFFDSATSFDDVFIQDKNLGCALFSDTHWNGMHISNVNWVQVKMLGDEQKAQVSKKQNRGLPNKKECLKDYRKAVRANRQLAAVLKAEGLNEEASRFAYRAQILQREVYWYQKDWKRYLFSLFLSLLTGYGYKPWRSFLSYILVISAFAIAYYLIGQTSGPSVSWVGSFVFSVTSFHGRGFFPGGIALDDPLTVIAAIEAFVGLLIEVTFIATLTQRLFGT
jgi:uncharacterized protein YjbI with pentapeptide repeats